MGQNSTAPTIEDQKVSKDYYCLVRLKWNVPKLFLTSPEVYYDLGCIYEKKPHY